MTDDQLDSIEYGLANFRAQCERPAEMPVFILDDIPTGFAIYSANDTAIVSKWWESMARKTCPTHGTTFKGVYWMPGVERPCCKEAREFLEILSKGFDETAR